MALAIPFVIAFLIIIIVRRFLFTILHRPLVRETAAPEEEPNNIWEQVLHIVRPAGVALVADSRFENCSDRENSDAGEQRVETYLRRIVTLTGARQMDNSYVLDVGKVRFHVRDGYVKRIPDGVDPRRARWETCFHSAHQDMAMVEQIATVLLQLKSNPWLFDSWNTKRELAFKADGQMFNRPK
jgi:hypothetical protein